MRIASAGLIAHTWGIEVKLQASVLREDARGFQILDQQGEVVISSEF